MDVVDANSAWCLALEGIIKQHAELGAHPLSPAQYKDLLGREGHKIANVKMIKHKVRSEDINHNISDGRT